MYEPRSNDSLVGKSVNKQFFLDSFFQQWDGELQDGKWDFFLLCYENFKSDNSIYEKTVRKFKFAFLLNVALLVKVYFRN